MVQLETSDLISISEANKLGISSLIRQAEQGRQRVLLRNNKPVAVVISMAHLEQLQELEEEIADIALTTARMLTTGPERRPLDDILAQFGYTRAALRDLSNFGE